MRKYPHLARFGAILEKCSQCGLCNAECPILARTGRTGDGPRGKIAILRALLEGQVSVRECAWHLERCALCGKCSKACPALPPLEHIFFAARFDLAKYLYPRSWRKSILALVHAHPLLLSRLQPALALAQKYVSRRTRRGNRLDPGTPELPMIPFRLSRQAEKEHKVLLFTGCLARHVYPQIAHACVAALSRHGYQVLQLELEGCCGRPLAAYGAIARVLKLTRHNLKQIAPLSFDRLLTICPCCLHSIRQLWPSLEALAENEKFQVRELARNAVGIAEFLAGSGTDVPHGSLAGILPETSGEATEVKRLAWHKPCLQDSSDCMASLKLMRRGAGLEILPLEQETCCGSTLVDICEPGQATRIRHPGRPAELDARPGRRMVTHLRDALLATGAGGTVTGCPWCILALEKAFARQDDGSRPLHTMEIYARLIGEAPKN